MKNTALYVVKKINADHDFDPACVVINFFKNGKKLCCRRPDMHATTRCNHH